MNPILFDKSARDFTTNGLGRIQCISCEVTEEANGAFELEAVCPVDTPHYSEIVNDNIICAIPSDGGTLQAFRIYKVTKPLAGTFTVNARHISYWLSFIVCKPFSAANVGAALVGLKSNAMQECPFTFWTDKSTIANYSQDAPASIRSRLGGVEGSILDAYGGQYEFDNFNVKLWNDRGHDSGVTIRYGKNLTNLNQEQSIEETITGIVPFWMSETQTVYYNGIVEASTAANFAHKRTVPYDFSSDFENPPTAAQLKARAERYILRNKIGIPKVSIKVSFIALSQTDEYKNIAPLERVKLFDDVTVYYPKLDISAKAMVTKTVYDCLRERYTEIEIGDLRSDFASVVVGLNDALTTKQAVLLGRSNETNVKLGNQGALLEEIQGQVAELDDEIENLDISGDIQAALDVFRGEMEAAIEDATDEIIGGNGGNIVTHLNANGQPYELLITDNINLARAKNIWRWNIGGLGYSKNGYNGPFSTAITQSGSIVADFITAGSLNAGIIKTGILNATLIRTGSIIDKKNKNFWDLDSGTFRTAGGTFTNISATGGTFTNITCQGGTFNSITANGGNFSNISATGGTFTNITAVGITATGEMMTVGPVDTSDNMKPFTRLTGGRIECGKNNGVGSWIEARHAVTDGNVDYACMRINAPALMLTGQLWTSKTTAADPGTFRKGYDYSNSKIGYDLDFTGGTTVEDIPDIEMDWSNLGLEFVNGLLVGVKQNGHDVPSGTVV